MLLQVTFAPTLKPFQIFNANIGFKNPTDKYPTKIAKEALRRCLSSEKPSVIMLQECIWDIRTQG